MNQKKSIQQNIKLVKFSFNLIFVILFSSCNKEANYPLIYTGEVTNVNNKGAVFNAKISTVGSDEIIECGFIWDTISPSYERSEKIIIRNLNDYSIINKEISTTLKTGIIYYVKAFVKTKKYISFGNEVAFRSLGSLAPIITDFIPQKANINDTILIIGDNFSYTPQNNKVTFNNFQASVIKSVQDTLWVIVPNNLNFITSTIGIEILKNKYIFAEYFNLITPIIQDFNNKIETFESEISIVGDNFLSNSKSLYVFFGDVESEIISIEKHKIVVKVPRNLNTRQCKIFVKMNNILISSKEDFMLKSTFLIDFYPKSAKTGDLITISGKNFSPYRENIIITIDGIKCIVESASLNELKFYVPYQNEGYFKSRNVEIKVDIFGDEKSFSKKLYINEKWFRLKNAPINFFNNEKSVCWVYNENAYFLEDNSNSFYKYIPVNDQWEKLSDFPGDIRFGATGFNIDNKIYYGTGCKEISIKNYEFMNDFWEYDILLNSWTKKNDFQGSKRKNAISFHNNKFGYLGLGGTNYPYINTQLFKDIWKYSPIDDIWIYFTDYIGFNSTDFGMFRGIAVESLNEVIIGLGETNNHLNNTKLYKLNLVNEEWQYISEYPIKNYHNYPISFTFKGNVYITTIHSNYLYSYDQINNKWNNIEIEIKSNYNKYIPGFQIEFVNQIECAFSIGEKVYFGIGNELWEYDPSI